MPKRCAPKEIQFLISRSQSLETAYISDIVGIRPTYLKNALVDLSSISRTHFTVLNVDSPTKETTRLETHSLSLWMIEPHLQSLQGESFDNRTTTTEDEARLDIKANGLWGSRFSRTYFHVKIFNPHAKSCPKTIKDAYNYHESIKKLKYEQRITKIEQSSFMPLIFSSTGGAGPKATKTIVIRHSKVAHVGYKI